MNYLPAVLIAVCYISFQFAFHATMIKKHGTAAYFCSECGNYYPLLAVSYVGGKDTEIDINDGKESSHKRKVPPLLEIRYYKDNYIIRNLGEACMVTVTREQKVLPLTEGQEITLSIGDEVNVLYENLKHEYTFFWGEE